MSDKKDKSDMGIAPGSGSSDIEDIGQITNAVVGHLRANPETQKRTDNIIQVFLGGAIASSAEENEKSDFAEDHPAAPPEAVGLAEYVKRKKKKLLKSGYTPLQASLILMAELGQLSAFTSIANNEKIIGVIRRVMTHEVKKGAQAQEAEQAQGKPSTAVGRVSSSHRDRSKFAMRGHGHRNRS